MHEIEAPAAEAQRAVMLRELVVVRTRVEPVVTVARRFVLIFTPADERDKGPKFTCCC